MSHFFKGSQEVTCRIIDTKWFGWRVKVEYKAQLDHFCPVFTTSEWIFKWRVKE